MRRRAGIAGAKGQTLSVPPDYNQEKKVHQGVCAATAPLAALLDKSLLRQNEGSDSEPRFTMLETIREFALEQLVASDEIEIMRQRHAAYYLALTEEAEPLLRTGEQLDNRFIKGRFRRQRPVTRHHCVPYQQALYE